MNQLGPAAYNLAWETYKEQMEFMVDQLARVIAPTLKLPKLDKPLSKRQANYLLSIKTDNKV